MRRSHFRNTRNYRFWALFWKSFEVPFIAPPSYLRYLSARWERLALGTARDCCYARHTTTRISYSCAVSRPRDRSRWTAAVQAFIHKSADECRTARTVNYTRPHNRCGRAVDRRRRVILNNVTTALVKRYITASRGQLNARRSINTIFPKVRDDRDGFRLVFVGLPSPLPHRHHVYAPSENSFMSSYR